MSLALETLNYTGNAEWREVSSSSLEEDPWGFDVLTRTFEGRPDKLGAFRAQYPKNKEDAVFKWLFVTKRSTPSVRGAWLSCTIEFKGTLDRQPKVNRSASLRLQPLELTTGTGAVATVGTQAQYYGPVRTFKYITTERPTRPLFKDELLPTELDFQIVNQRTAGKIVVSRGDQPETSKTSNLYVIPRVFTSRFDFEEVGRCWQVTEEHEGRLEAYALRR